MTMEANHVQRSRSSAALLDAYDRLRKGKGGVTDGRLNVTNVAREAGVSRATAYRCAELLALFDEHPKPTKAKPKAMSGNAELRDVVNRLLNRIIMLEAALEAKDAEIRQLRSMLPKPQEAGS
ncbi:hypothetical protein [Sphingobium sp. CCH11-B1]|uniref:hypothetical protein n=1 Tax=Sphingobium sp. CCH11-B1 TaxID=1768781 RepID=UPI000A42FFB3|nr:hypothetical protein [Sphingobium sp. CCH11-B1]